MSNILFMMNFFLRSMQTACCLLAFTLFQHCGSSGEFNYDLVISNVRLFDGQKLTERASIGVKDGVVSQISEDLISSASQTIDGTGKTLLPALINSHVHVHHPSQLKEAASAGVLTVLDLFNTAQGASLLRKYRDSVAYADFYSSGPVVTVAGGHGTQYGFDTPTLSGAENAVDFVNKRIEEGSDFIKLILEVGHQYRPRPTLSDSMLLLSIQAAKAREKITVVHVSERADALKSIAFGADGLAHIWRKDTLAITEKEILNFAEKDFFIIPTLLVRKRQVERYPDQGGLGMDQMKQELFELYSSGATVLAGTDPPNLNINYGTDLVEEVVLLTSAGLPEVEAIMAATSNPARHFKLEGKGFIKEGGPASFIMVNGDPFNNIHDLHKIEAIWKNGRLVK